jgi:hypothetical protein
LAGGLSVIDERAYRNPMFSFMIFADGGDYDLMQVLDLYRTRRPENLPTATCILDRAVIGPARIKTDAAGRGDLGPVSVYPQLEKRQTVEGTMRWVEHPLGTQANRGAAVLGYLYMALMGHLNSCTLTRPQLLQYLQGLFSYAGGRAFADVI